jgi:phosphoglycolate phosphatase
MMPSPLQALPRAILFDWDNTLVDTWLTIHEALNHVIAAMDKLLWSFAETRARVRRSLRESFPAHFSQRWEEAREIYLERLRAIRLERLTPLPGCEVTIEGLATSGIFLGVVSNKTGGLLRQEAEQLGWSGHFGRIVGAGDATADKPDPAPVGLALEPSGVAAGAGVWFVGDTEVDIKYASNAGCVSVLLGAQLTAEEVLRCAPHFTFAEPAALLRCVRGLRFTLSSPSRKLAPAVQGAGCQKGWAILVPLQKR